MAGLATKLSRADRGPVAAAGERLRSVAGDDRLEPVRSQAREARRDAAATAAGALEQIKGAVGAVGGLVGTLADVLAGAIRLVAAVPAAAARVLEAAGRLLGDAEERGRELAQAIEPPRTERRRRRLAVAGVFIGGFATGAAAGWLLHDRLHEHPDQPVGDPDWAAHRSQAHTGPAASIDARHAR